MEARSSLRSPRAPRLRSGRATSRGAQGPALVALVLCAACATLRPPPPPPPLPVEVEELELRFEGDNAGLLELSLSVLNPSTQAATASEVDWELWVEGRRFATGMQSVAVPVPPGERARVQLQIPLAFRRRTLVTELRPVELGVRGEVAVGERPLKFERLEHRVLPKTLATDVDED